MVVKKKKTTAGKASTVKMVRKNRVTISLNDKEMAVLNRFYEKYKITNHTKWLRETIIVAILKKFDADAPKLFGEDEMR
ncbi:MAG TPA: hypothetical protein PLN63_04910 [Paludibacteraceae bacterium]|jgi:hypothetical protein|nr:hypothetical protein [Paludibacteraceae bacterium]HOU68335.1 hypothetical protein [Paludibacteraceae bacterium]HPH62939.1 hypothetical protein [Paludibacteraceae bacterium]HQF50174.1 hypothetical protein [Paludibacteraceae bacterium]HQJ90031.1 hypothetical protein [Paludibacteraceae bacterium]